MIKVFNVVDREHTCLELWAWIDRLGRGSESRIQRWRRYLHSSPVQYRLPIQIAAFFDFADEVRRELDRGLDVDATKSEGISTLCEDASGDAVASTELLLKAGADPDYNHGYAGFTPLTWSVRNTGKLSSSFETTPAYRAATILIHSGANTQLRDMFGGTVLRDGFDYQMFLSS